MMQGLQLLGTIKLEKAVRNYGYIVTDLDGSIEGISSSFTPLMIKNVKIFFLHNKVA